MLRIIKIITRYYAFIQWETGENMEFKSGIYSVEENYLEILSEK